MRPLASRKRAKLEQFIQEQGGRAYGAAFRLCGNVDEARELVQEACYRAALKSDQYDASRPFAAWFFTILRNIFLDSRRRYERRYGVSLDCPISEEGGASYQEIVSDGAEDILQRLEREETTKEVRAAVKGLGEDQRAVLKLCETDGLNYNEIARRLGVARGTIASRLNRARRALRNLNQRQISDSSALGLLGRWDGAP